MPSAGKVAELGPKVAAALGTRGGMRPGAFQGKVGSFDRLPQALKVLHDSLAQSRRSLDNVVRNSWLCSQSVVESVPVAVFSSLTALHASILAAISSQMCMPHLPTLPS